MFGRHAGAEPIVLGVASQPDIHIAGDDSWTTPSFSKVSRQPPDLVYLADDGRFYTFEFERVTCAKCISETDPD